MNPSYTGFNRSLGWKHLTLSPAIEVKARVLIKSSLYTREQISVLHLIFYFEGFDADSK